MPPGPEPAELPADAVEVGRVLGPWGVQGSIRVQPYSASPEALFSCRQWYLQAPSPPRPASLQGTRLVSIREVRAQGNVIVANAEQIADRTGAESLQGARIFISRAAFPSLAEGEYYWVDLIGLAVVNRQGLALGEVTDLMTTGPQQVLVVRDRGVSATPSGAVPERLIPFVDAYVDAVDLQGRCITVDWQPDY